jgi:hypothetical protein
MLLCTNSKSKKLILNYELRITNFYDTSNGVGVPDVERERAIAV